MKKLFLALLITSNPSLHSTPEKIEYVNISITKKHKKKVAAGMLLTVVGATIVYKNQSKTNNLERQFSNAGLGLSAIGIALLSYTAYQHLYNNDDQEIITTTKIDPSLLNQSAIQNSPQEQILVNPDQQEPQKNISENPQLSPPIAINQPSLVQNLLFQEHTFRRTSEADISTLGQW